MAYDDPICKDLNGCKWGDISVSPVFCCKMYIPNNNFRDAIDTATSEIREDLRLLGNKISAYASKTNQDSDTNEGNGNGVARRSRRRRRI